MDSTWLIRTRLGVQQITDRITAKIDKSDRLLVIDITNDAYNGWLTEDAWTWIRERIAG